MRTLALALALSLALPLAAEAQQRPSASDRQFLESETFLAAHPDLRDRLAGLRNYQKGDYEYAMTIFRRAARYGDKPSQAMVAEMYWMGRGVPQDRVLAYIWMDLAAERGFPLMIQQREKYWNELSESERARAVAEGEAIFAEYGDEVAKPRLANVLRRERRNVTGSRTGFVGALTLIIPTPNGMMSINPKDYFDEKYWDPEQYQTWMDQEWKHPRKATVDVGEVMVNPPPADAADEGEGEGDQGD